MYSNYLHKIFRLVSNYLVQILKLLSNHLFSYLPRLTLVAKLSNDWKKLAKSAFAYCNPMESMIHNTITWLQMQHIAIFISLSRLDAIIIDPLGHHTITTGTYNYGIYFCPLVSKPIKLFQCCGDGFVDHRYDTVLSTAYNMQQLKDKIFHILTRYFS